MLSYLDFINEAKANAEGRDAILAAFGDSGMQKAQDLINSTLSEHIDNLIPLTGYVDTIVDGMGCLSKVYIVADDAKDMVFQINWLKTSSSTKAYSIDFFKGLGYYANGHAKSDLSIYTMGTSIACFLPAIWHVASTHKFSLTQDSIRKMSANAYGDDVKESQVYVGGLMYRMLEKLTNKIIDDAFMIEAKKDKRLKEVEVMKDTNKAAKEIEDVYAEIEKALRGSDAKISTVNAAVKSGIKASIESIHKSVGDPDGIIETIKAHMSDRQLGDLPEDARTSALTIAQDLVKKDEVNVDLGLFARIARLHASLPVEKKGLCSEVFAGMEKKKKK